MRILFYAHSSTLYGANRSLIDLILGFKKNNPEIVVLVIIPSSNPLGAELKRNSINFEAIPHYNWFYNKEVADKWRLKSLSIFKLWFYKNKYAKILKNRYNLKRHLNAAKKFNPDFIYINSSLAPMGLIVSERLGVKNIWHHRETVNEAFYGYYLEDIKKLTKYFKQTDLHIFTSEFLLKQFAPFRGKSKKVIFNGVVPASVLLNRTFNSEKIRFGIVGRINNQKGQKEIIELFTDPDFSESKYPIELHIVGVGDKDFMNWLQLIKTSNIIFHNYLDRYDIYDKFDFLIANSVYEAFGRTIAEANFNGIPVVARNSGAFPEIISKINGYIYSNMMELKLILEELSYIKMTEYSQLSESSYRFANNSFYYTKIAKSVHDEIISLKNMDE